MKEKTTVTFYMSHVDKYMEEEFMKIKYYPDADALDKS